MSARADSHIHLFHNGFEGDGGLIEAGVHEYDAIRIEEGIDAALAVGYEGGSRYAGNNAYLRTLATMYPWIHSLAYLPTAPLPGMADFARLRSEGHDGFALYLVEPGASLAGLKPGDEALRGAVVSVNAGPAQLSRFHSDLTELRDSVVMVSHLGLPGVADDLVEVREKLGPLVALAEESHVVVKVSGLYAIDPAFPFAGAATAFDVVLDAFGPDRLVWGSDFSPALAFGTPAEVFAFPEWLGGRLNPSERAAVEGNNLRRLLSVA